MATQKNTEKTPSFFCELCDFKCSRKTEYSRHIETMKHKRLHETTKKTPNIELKVFNCICGNKYNHHTSLAKHKRKCTAVKSSSSTKATQENDNTNSIDDEIFCDGKITITKEMFIKLLKDNEEMMKMIKSLSENQLVTPQQVTNNNNNNNITNITNNNNQFNLNIFLK